MPNPAVRTLLIGSTKKFLLLDSNLLLLWVTASYDLRLLRTFKRVHIFSQADATFLAWLVDQFAGIVTTSHIVTEASNLANSLSSYSRLGWFDALATFAAKTKEDTRSLESIAPLPEFVQFGVADCAILHLADSYQVLTMDHRLSNSASAQGKQVLNFDDLRKMI